MWGVRNLPECGINHLFSRMLPKKRAKRDMIFKWSCIGLLFIAGSYASYPGSFNYLVTTPRVCYMIFCGIEFIQRLCSLGEERHHLESRYKNSVYFLLKEVFSFNQWSIVCFATSATSLIDLHIHDFGAFAWVCSVSAVGLFVRIIKLNLSHLSLALHVDYLKGMDCGTYMAHSYFYGYLDIVVPSRGDETKGLKEHMIDYQGSQTIEFASTKLYIFIASSGYSPISLSDRSRKFLPERAKNLEYNIVDRSGVRGRDYHNSVYKIEHDKKILYVCAEYASPLHTLYKIRNRSTVVSGLYEKYYPEIVFKFYHTLQNILNSDPQFKDLVELIYFNDLDENGEPLDKDKLDIADLLLERLPKKNALQSSIMKKYK